MSVDDDRLGALTSPLDAPPPSPRLRALVDGMAPARPRRPGAELAIALGLAGAWAALAACCFPLRDLAAVTRGPWAAVAGGFVLVCLVDAALALVPRRGQVLPDATRASVVAGFTALVSLGAAALYATATGDGRSVEGATAGLLLARCLGVGALVAGGPILGGAWLARRLAPVGAWRLGAAFGAAGGGLGALVLHLHCSVGGALHVGLGHGGATLLGALAGGAVAALVSRR